VDGAGPETTSTDAAVAAGSARVPTDREKPRRRRVAAVRRPRIAATQEAPVSDLLRPKPRPDATEG
ncbi:MAG: hypothetical protein ACKO2D_05085, partial [Chloroflexota bacterium]